MGFYEPGIGAGSFEPDPDGLLRVRRCEVEEAYDIGEVVSIDDDEIMGFARVMRLQGDPARSWICLEQLAGTSRPTRPRWTWSFPTTTDATPIDGCRLVAGSTTILRP